MQAVSMSKRQQTTNRMDHTVSKAETPVQGRAHSNVVSPSTYIDASLLTWEDRGGEGVGQYERRRQRAKAAGMVLQALLAHLYTNTSMHVALGLSSAREQEFETCVVAKLY